jgi:hypothetical protein
MPPVRVLPTAPLPKVRLLDRPPLWPEGLQAIDARRVEGKVQSNACARPWDRDAVDRSIFQ